MCEEACDELKDKKYPKFLDLRLDRNLIKPNFDGYKLSLAPTPVLRVDLDNPPFRAKPADDQYSFLHTELFTMHNHLTEDPWDRASSYFFGRNGDILKAYFDGNTGRPRPTWPVFKFTGLPRQIPGIYNVSFQFISEKFCIFCDGDNEIVLLDTGDRYKNVEWKVVFRCSVSSDFKGFVIRDSRLDTVDEKKVISCALQRVQSEESTHITQIFWCILKEDAKNSWTYELKDVLFGKGMLYYCAFEPRAQSLIVCSSKEFKFKSKIGSEEEIEPKVIKDDAEKATYSWSQTDEDVTIKFPTKEGLSKSDCKIMCTKNSLTVKCLEEVIITGTLYSSIDANLTTWSLENDFLQITMQKEAPCETWPVLVEGGPNETSEADNRTSFIEEKPIANLEAQIEECDFPVSALEEEYAIDRLNLKAGVVTHKITLGNNCPIFSTHLRPGFPPAIVTRQDVDASIWLQQYNPAKPDEWQLRHEGNLHAFGYVQASKQQKKFIGCAPDLSYSVICESHRHVFIYKANYDTADGLRNRNGPQVAIGKQSLVTLEDAGEIVGMSTSDNIITLLTEKCILYLQLGAS